MKLSRRLRSLGAALVCFSMVLCNVPLIRAQNATIIVDGIIVGGSVYGNGTGELVNRSSIPMPGTVGGPPPSGIPDNNTVIIDNGMVDGGIYGSWIDTGIVSNNSVTITGSLPGSSVHNVYGGYVELGIAFNNEVTIENNSRVEGDVVGGYAYALTTDPNYGTADSNTVNIRSGANITGDVYGGRSGSAMYNVVNIEGGIINGSKIVGGGSDDTDALSAYYNQVNISNDSIITGNVYGGFINIADTLENTVNITGGLLNGNVYGGVTEFGNSLGNIVNIEGAVVSGGREIIGGRSTQGSAIGNEIYITNSQFLNNSGAIYGGATNIGDANENIVNIDGGEVGIQGVTGGSSSIGNSNGNTVTIGETSGKFNISNLTGGSSASGSASNNSVTVYRGTFNTVYGGTAGGNGNATGNKVIIYGGTFTGNIVGGSSSSGTATGNLVDINRGVTFGSNARIYGGISNAGRDSRSGNTLNIRDRITVYGIDNFEKYNFYLPGDIKADETMITVTASNGNNGAIDLKDVKVEIGVSEGSKLQQGDTVILIDEQGRYGFNGAPANNASDGSTLDVTDRSGLVNYRFGLSVAENQLLASVGSASLDERTDSIPEGFLSGLILANQGADAIAGSAMDSAMTAAHKGPIEGLGGFGSLIIGKSEYNTGSDVDMLGVSAAAGLALGADFVSGSLTLGPFFEYGKAEFDTVNSLGNGQDVIGDGDSEYMGGGFLLRMDYKDVGLGRYFAEASARVGKQTNNFNIKWPGEETFSYKSSAPYYGLHLGYGGSWDVAPSAALDIYGKYFFARGDGSNVSTSNGENIDFEAVTSNRVRGGARMAYVPGDSLALSFGGAYEYEISGEIKASMLSYTINAPSLKGGTGIGEVVVGYKPSPSSKTSINIGVQGYAGKRQGVTASLFVRF